MNPLSFQIERFVRSYTHHLKLTKLRTAPQQEETSQGEDDAEVKVSISSKQKQIEKQVYSQLLEELVRKRQSK